MKFFQMSDFESQIGYSFDETDSGFSPTLDAESYRIFEGVQSLSS
ncbi:MAG: hypothetical protein ACLRU1_09200 [Veillonella parvula]